MPDPTITAEVSANIALVRRYKTEILNSRDVAALGEVAAVDYLDHAALPGQAPGLEGLRQRAKRLFQWFDPQWTIDDVIAARDMVVLRWHLSGRHLGAYLGLPATGKPCVIRGIDMYRVRHGLMCEHWNVVDNLGFAQQVGLVPHVQPEGAAAPRPLAGALQVSGR